MGLLKIYLRVLALLGPDAELDAQGRFVPDAQPEAQPGTSTEQPAATFRDFA